MKSSRLQKVLNHFIGLLLFVFIFVNALQAVAGPGKTTYQAKIVKPDGYPLEASSVNFKFTILDPAGNCILYSETYSSVNMSSTGGLISFALGSGVKTYPVSATTFEQVFSNITPSLSCDTGGPASYSPVATDIRKIVMQFHDGSGWQTLPAMSINAVPYAMYANEATRLNGLTSSDFVQLSTVPTCAASEALRYTGASFSCVAVGNSVTSGTVVTALGYTPADSVSLTTVTANVSSVSSTVFSVSSTVTSLQNSVAVSFAAITSSQWTTSGTNIFYNSSNVGIGTTTPVTALDVSGGVRISMESATCAVSFAGTLRYNAGNVEYCNGTTWSAFGVATSGLTSLNGTTSQTQSFANGTVGTAPAFNTANGVHTLNIPLASTGSVTAGLISNTDYTAFTNKITSSAASIAQVLGYVPADNAASGTYAQKANNLSDLTNIATARTNLGLGTFATASSIDLGSASATGTLAIARLPSFSGDATVAAASNTIILSNSGITAGTYTKVTVDAKGRVTSSSALASTDVTTALGYTPASASASTQWTTSGSAIYYNTGNVGIGTSTPAAKLEVAGDVRLPDTAVIQFGPTWGTGVLNLRNGPTTAAIVDVPNNKIVNNLGKYYTAATAPGVFGTQDNFNLQFHTNSINRMTIDTAGNVGINTTAPTQMLDVVKALGDGFTRMKTDDVDSDSGFIAQNDAQTWKIYNKAGYSDALVFEDVNASVQAMTIKKSTGNVGIGTTNPSYPLHVSGTVYSSSNISNMVVGTSGQQMEAGNSALTTLRFDSDAYRIFAGGAGGAGEIVHITETGSVGIGTTAPSAKLHLAAGTSSNAPLKLTSGTLLTSPQSGTMEYDGTNFYLTDSTNTRRAIAANTNPGTYDNVSNINSSSNITLTPTGSVVVSSTTASTNSSTGALIVNGGLGVAGNLNVAGTISGSAKVMATGFRANQGSPDSNDSSTNGYAFGADGDTGMFSPGSGATNGVLAFYGNNAELMRITNGNVGIGTSSPSARLEVTSPNDTSTALYVGNSTSAGVTGLYFSRWGGASAPMGIQGTISGSGANAITLQAQAGNVGIGTTAPEGKLEIKLANTTYNAAITKQSDYGDAVYLTTNANPHKAALFLRGSDKIGAGIESGREDAGTTWKTYLAFMTNNLTAGANPVDSIQEKMRITADGNVGIGTTNPSYPLDVKNQMRVGAQGGSDVTLIAGGSGYGSQIYQYYADGVLKNVFSANGNSYITAGSVGIGTSAPTNVFHVKAPSTYATQTSQFAVGDSATDMKLNVGVGTDGTNKVSWVQSTEVSISNDRNLALQPFGGKVGIGTTNPVNPFQTTITSGAGSPYVGINQIADNPFIELQRWTGTGSNYEGVRLKNIVGSGGQFAIETTQNGGAAIGSQTFTERMRIVGGNVGIGISTPANALDVSGSITVGSPFSGSGSQMINFRGANTDGAFIRFNSTSDAVNGTNLEIGTIDNSDEAITFTQTATERMRIHSNGYVGIGTNTPISPIHAYGGTAMTAGYNRTLTVHANHPSIQFKGISNTNHSAGILYDAEASSEGMRFIVGATSDDVFGTGANVMSLQANGNVGIGTSAPGGRLHIADYTTAGGKNLVVGDDSFLSDVDVSNTLGIYGNQDSTQGHIKLGSSGPLISGYTGFVGIGNATPAYTLDVSGDLRITGTPYRNGGDIAWTVPSDARLKDVIRTYDRGLREIANLDMIIFKYKKDNPKQINSDKEYTGVIAQQVQEQIPEAVSVDKDGFLSLNTTPIFWAMINAIKELYSEITGVNREVAAIKAENAELKKQNEEIKAYLCSKDPQALICQ